MHKSLRKKDGTPFEGHIEISLDNASVHTLKQILHPDVIIDDLSKEDALK